MTEVDAERQFGKIVQRARKQRGWSQADLAGLLNDATGGHLHQTVISRIESGTRPIRLNEAAALASLLGLEITISAGGGLGADLRVDPRDSFQADLARMNAQLVQFGAVVTAPDGFTYIDEAKVPKLLLSAYRGLIQFGYANGLLGSPDGTSA